MKKKILFGLQTKKEKKKLTKFFLTLIPKTLTNLTYYISQQVKGEDEEIEILASSYIQDEEGKQGQLKPVETDEEWDMIEEILATFLADEDEE